VEASTLVDHHLLLVPSTVYVEDVDALISSRLQGARLIEDGEVQLGRHCRLSGPYELSMEDAVAAAVPMPWTACYDLDAPVDREDPPLPGADDRDGFAFAFPDGLPWRDEGRALHLLVSLARRLDGAVRTAGSLQLILPDPDRAVDFSAHSPDWLEPAVLLGVVSRELASVRLAAGGGTRDWTGPADTAYSGEATEAETRGDPLSPEDLEALHVAADDTDLQVLADGLALDAYALVADLGPGGRDGAAEILVRIGEDDEPSVAGLPWAAEPFISYEVRWVSPDPLERERRVPSADYLAARERVAPVIAAVTRAVVEAAHGVVTDEDGFPVDRYAL
jgi:hypothetical protein